MKIAGIDPGLTGAVVILKPTGSPEFYDTPVLKIKTKKVMDANSAAVLLWEIQPDFVIIEKVWAMPGGEDHGVKMGASSAFGFGMGFGMWLGIIASFQFPHEQVTPVKWKGLLMAGMDKEKDASRLRAMQLFPACTEDLKLKKHHGRADALLLAEYGRRILEQPISR